jgi:hypothetical protein
MGGAMNNSISDHINYLRDVTQTHQYSCDTTSSSVRLVHAPIPVELYSDLLIMASEFKRDPNCLAGDLLPIAIYQAFDSLSGDEKARLKGLEVVDNNEQAIKHVEDCKYDWGGT